MGQGYETVEVLPNGTVLFDCGPMRMFIQVSERGEALVELAKEGAKKAREVLEDLALLLPVIKKKTREINVEGEYPEVVRRMIEATRRMEEPDLTPMAAVAGAASDAVADSMILQGYFLSRQRVTGRRRLWASTESWSMRQQFCILNWERP